MFQYRALWPALAAVMILASVAHGADPYQAPASYYANVTGTGATLKSQLATAMSTGQINRSYGDFRYMAGATDADPNHVGNILLAYTRQSVSATWDSGSTWNREHVWPQSRQPGSANNGTRGSNLSDPHALRPLNPSVNSSRSNKPFGGATLTGTNRHNGAFYFPGDQDKGDVARSLFYSATRYASSGLTLVNGSALGTHQMGDLASLIRWHYLDTPDDFERRRNQAVFSQSLNPSYYTNNRNAYVDRPEYAWSVFMDQQNDTHLTLGGGAVVQVDGSSVMDFNFGRVIRGASILTQGVPVFLNKAGLDGTYYSVTASGDVTANEEGRYHAFAMDSAGSRTLGVNLNADTNTVGTYAGSVVIDNLDVTTQGGVGQGANDGNDVVNMSLQVVEHSNASFADATDVNTLTIDLGAVSANTSASQTFSIFNHATAALTAGLDFDNFQVLGNSDRFNLNFSDFDALLTGSSADWSIDLFTDQLGAFGALYTFNFSDENLLGKTTGQTLQLNVVGTVVPEPGTLALLLVTGLGLMRRRGRVTTG